MRLIRGALSDGRGRVRLARASVAELERQLVLAAARSLDYLPYGAARTIVAERLAMTGLFSGGVAHDFETTTVFGAPMRGNTRDIIQAHLFAFREWEPDLTAFLRARIKPGETFVDVGANVGYFTLLGAHLVGPRGRVVAVEASPEIHRRLAANVALGGASVRLVNEAASDAEGHLELFAGPAWNSGMSTTVEPDSWRRAGIDAAFGRSVTVSARPLDLILSPEELATARLVKIDVEGAELRVVRGMSALLARGPRTLEVVVEVNAPLLASEGEDPEALLRLFADAGFFAYALPADYGVGPYLSAERRRPRRLRGPSALGVADLVFSRIDAAEL